jgi:hypothetical protein
MLVRIVAPRFVAGMILDRDRVIDAAPILARYIGKDGKRTAPDHQSQGLDGYGYTQPAKSV